MFKSRQWLRLKRDVRVFAHLFPWRVAIFLLVGWAITADLFLVAYNYVRPEGDQHVPLTYIKAVFAVINMTFFQLTYADMPAGWELDIFPILVPLVGLPLFSILGLKVLNIIRIFFIRAERGQEWQETLVRSTVKNHIIICGLGRVGYRVAKELLLEYDQPIVGIEAIPSPLVEELMAADLPVIFGDAENEEALKKAGVERAKTVLVCTNHDWANLGIAFRARELNSNAQIILRLFEDEMVEAIRASFKVDAVISRSAVAALSFTYAAMGGEIIETFALAERAYVLARIPLAPTSPLVGQTIAAVAEAQDVTIVCYNCGRTLTVEPAPETVLRAGDSLFVFTITERLVPLIESGGQRIDSTPPRQGAVLVCGLGHTGYRVVTNLLDLGCNVVALDFEAGRLSQRLNELGVPLKFGDMRWKSILTEAGVAEAAALVACTEDDMTNLQIALQARALNPHIRIVMRIFDDKLGQQLRQIFGIYAVYSTSALASPDFVSAALNRMNVRTVDIGGIEQAIVRLQVGLSALYDLPIEDLHAEEGLTMLLHARDGHINIPPLPGTRLQVRDEIVVLVAQDKVEELNRRNKTWSELQAEDYG